MKYLFTVLFFITFCNAVLFAQNKTIQLPANLFQNVSAGGVHDFSDPTSINIKVDVWGDIPQPGKYVIPYYTTINDLLSFAGGPEPTTDWSGIKLFRMNPDSSYYAVKLHYEDYINKNIKDIPKEISLESGDILVIPSSGPVMTWRDYIYLLTPIITIANFIFYFIRK